MSEWAEGQKPDKFVTLTRATSNALTKLQGTDPATYARIASIVLTEEQQFFDVLNSTVAEDPTVERLSAHELLDTPGKIGTGFHGGARFEIRATLIDWLKDKPSAKDLVELLKEFQVLYPRDTTP